jgi:hypothetical protein
MSKKQNSTRFEKHIYIENRSGALRFKVVVTPLQDSATFSTEEEGALWARRRRVELLEDKAGMAKAQVHPDLILSDCPEFPKFSIFFQSAAHHQAVGCVQLF